MSHHSQPLTGSEKTTVRVSCRILYSYFAVRPTLEAVADPESGEPVTCSSGMQTPRRDHPQPLLEKRRGVFLIISAGIIQTVACQRQGGGINIPLPTPPWRENPLACFAEVPEAAVNKLLFFTRGWVGIGVNVVGVVLINAG